MTLDAADHAIAIAASIATILGVVLPLVAHAVGGRSARRQQGQNSARNSGNVASVEGAGNSVVQFVDNSDRRTYTTVLGQTSTSESDVGELVLMGVGAVAVLVAVGLAGKVVLLLAAILVGASAFATMLIIGANRGSLRWWEVMGLATAAVTNVVALLVVRASSMLRALENATHSGPFSEKVSGVFSVDELSLLRLLLAFGFVVIATVMVGVDLFQWGRVAARRALSVDDRRSNASFWVAVALSLIAILACLDPLVALIKSQFA